jgi:hypothetical protein
MAAIKPRKLTMPVRRVTRFDQAMNRGLSALGRPSSSQMIESGSFRA